MDTLMCLTQSNDIIVTNYNLQSTPICEYYIVDFEANMLNNIT